MLKSVILLFFHLWCDVEVSSSQIACLTLPDVPHGYISEETKITDYQGGHVIHFTCEPGYKTSGPTITYVCSSEGWLAVQQETCHHITCEVGVLQPHLKATGLPPGEDQIKIGQKLQFHCDDQFVIDGSIEIECLQNGEWNAAFPTCVEVQCPVPNIENGSVEGNIQMYKEHDVLHFRCNPRYQRIDFRLPKCTKQGLTAEWSPTPGCEPIMCRLPPPLVGTRYDQTSKNLFTPGETVGVSCGSKYWISTPLETSAVATCNDNGDWTLEPVCKEVKCSNQRFPNLRWSDRWFPEKALDETVGYSCESGYKKIDGATSAQCTRTGWEPKPFCQEITCDRQDHLNSAIDSDKKIFKYGDRVTYTCNDGYEGDFSLQCGTTGWTKPGQCIKVCKKPHIADAEIIRGNDKNTYSLNEQLRYTCSNNAKRVFTVTCEQSGWTGDMTCSACPTAVVPNGFIVGPHNDTLYYTCKEGYKLYTDGWWAEAKCTDGELSGLERCIANTTCGTIPEIPNGIVTRSRSKDATIACAKGYYPQVTQLTCQAGQWISKGFSPHTICTPTGVPCKPPQRVDNAVIVNSYQKEYLSDSEVTYQCRDKYMLLEHEDTIQCKDGQWEKKNITCTKKCTVASFSSSVRLNTHAPGPIRRGQKLRFYCNNNRDYLRGKQEVECLANGRWSDPFPTCGAPLGCESPPALADGDKVQGFQRQYRHGERVDYVCQNFYIREGDSYKTCNNGEWTGQIRCMKPCTVDKLVMRSHNIHFRYKDEDKLYSPHNDHTTFACTRGRPVGTLDMRRRCDDGVMHLPTCQ